jgi:hypothetical protein
MISKNPALSNSPSRSPRPPKAARTPSVALQFLASTTAAKDGNGGSYSDWSKQDLLKRPSGLGSRAVLP